jgi:hypothetical protein
MSYADHDLRLHVAPDAHVHLLTANTDRELDVAESFALGWSLAQQGKHSAALHVFAALAQQRPSDTQILTMWAECQAATGDDAGCSDCLQSVFDGDDDTITRLQSAFTAMRHGSWTSAAITIEFVAQKYPELPLFQLLLGRVHARCGVLDQAMNCWRAAVANDQPDGYVKLVARRILANTRNRQRSQQEVHHDRFSPS